MTVPGLRILTKYWKRYALVLLLGSCFLVTVRVVQGWSEDNYSDVIVETEDFSFNQVKAQRLPPVIEGQDGSIVANNEPHAIGNGDAGGNDQGGDILSIREMEMRNAKLEAELKYEKLKAELLNRDLSDAKKNPNDMAVIGDTSGKLMERRQNNIKRLCSEKTKADGMVNTLITNRNDVTYCVIPGVMDTFWLRVMRFVTRDYVLDIRSPYEISKKDAHDRPFVKAKQLKWNRLPETEKTKLLSTKIFMTVQNPFLRLWESYIHLMVLPTLWSAVGTKIEALRKPNQFLLKTGGKRKFCGKDIAFEEFIQYTLDSHDMSYEPYTKWCDPCQLTPTYIVKTETFREDSVQVLNHMHLDWMVNKPSYHNDTLVRYINDLITDIYPKFMRARAENCVTPGDIGRSLWKALKFEGLIPDKGMPPLIGQSYTIESLIEEVTNLYVKANLNVESQRGRMMQEAYKFVSTKTKDAIRKKYVMDFQYFEYSDKIEDATKVL